MALTSTDVNVNELVINKLTKSQYDSLSTSGRISSTELYMITDEDTSGNGSSVKFTPSLTSGNLIGTLNIDGTDTQLYSKEYSKLSEFENDSGYITSSTTLDGYGITDAYTKTETDKSFLSRSKVNTFSEYVNAPVISEDEGSEDWRWQPVFEIRDSYDSGVGYGVAGRKKGTLYCNEGICIVNDGYHKLEAAKTDQELKEIDGIWINLPGSNGTLALTSDIPDTSNLITADAVKALPISTFANDSGYITSHQSLSAYLTSDQVKALPVSTFTNDAGYMKKSEVVYANELPSDTSGISAGTIYLIPVTE